MNEFALSNEGLCSGSGIRSQPRAGDTVTDNKAPGKQVPSDGCWAITLLMWLAALMQSEGQEGREESGEAGAWVPGSDSWSAQGWLHHPPIPGPHAVPWQMQTAAGPRCGCTDCAEAMGFTLTLPGRHCPSPTIPRAEQGREGLPGPAARVGPAARHWSQGGCQFGGPGSIPARWEPTAPVSWPSQGCGWLCKRVPRMSLHSWPSETALLPVVPATWDGTLKELISQLDVQASHSYPRLTSSACLAQPLRHNNPPTRPASPPALEGVASAVSTG